MRELLAAARKVALCEHDDAERVQIGLTDRGGRVMSWGHWCSVCGTIQVDRKRAVSSAFEPRTDVIAPESRKRLREALDRAEGDSKPANTANDDDPAGTRYALRIAGERLQEALSLHTALSFFSKHVDACDTESAEAASARRVEVALAEYTKAEERLRAAQEGGGALE
jgi:hypothetical protein